MIKRTLYFGNPAYLSLRDEQLVINLAADKALPKGEASQVTVPIEDIGLLLLDHTQITLTQALLAKLLEHNVALVTCDASHHPAGLWFNLEGHSLQAQKFRLQAEASQPLKKQLWQQTVVAKISNQAGVLRECTSGHSTLVNYSRAVKSGDSDNQEAKAAAYYWKKLFPEVDGFFRERFGPPPNAWLNYGYAILRAIVARALTGSGLLPALGIHHRNQYNAFCLADDIMEPYRPYVDRQVKQLLHSHGLQDGLPAPVRNALLTLPTADVQLDGKTSPLLNAVSRTTASLARCFEGSSRKILYPVIPV